MAQLDYQRLQSIYSSKVLQHSDAKVRIRVPDFTHVDAYAAFTGDGQVSYPHDFTLPCLYRLRPSEDWRKKSGIDEDATAVMWVPMVQLLATLPDLLQVVWDRRQQLLVDFFGETYDVVLVRAYEPFGPGFTDAIGWELQLVQKEDRNGK